MADISKKCGNASECKKKNTCYRYEAYPSESQSYMDFYVKGADCKEYIEARAKSQMSRLDIQVKKVNKDIEKRMNAKGG